MLRMARRALGQARDSLVDARWKQLERRVNFRPENALVVCGDPRGGSTWLSEIVGSIPGTATLWEPLHVDNVKEVKDLGFSWRHYIDDDADAPSEKALFERIFRGRLLNRWICLRTTQKTLLNASQIQVKFCRATQLLPWLTRSFNFERAPIHLVRHPCAVIASQLKARDWREVPSAVNAELFDKNPLMSKYRRQFLTVDNQVKWLAAFWCACNHIALVHPGRAQKWRTLFYEELLVRPDEELRILARDWQLPDEWVASMRPQMASATTEASSPIAAGDARQQLVYWQRVLTADQIRDVLDMLELFEIDVYSSSEMPTKS